MNSTFRFSSIRDFGATVEFEDATVFLDYPSATTWEADIVVDPSVEEYNYRFLDRDGNYSPWFTISISLESQTPRERAATTTLDFWGYRLDTPRNPGESNFDYQERLLDVFVHRGGPTHEGLLNAVCRDLNLTYNDQALIVVRKNAQDTGYPYTNIHLGITSTKITVWMPEFRITEELFVNPVNRKVEPSRIVAGNLEIKTKDNKRVFFDYDSIDNLIYLTEDLTESTVQVTYLYQESIDRIGVTLEEIQADLEAIETPAGDQILTVYVASGYEDYLGDFLQMMPETTLVKTHLDLGQREVEGLPIRWSDLKIQVVWDEELSASMQNWSGSLWNTKVDHAYLSLLNLSRQTWGTAVADDSVWGDVEFPLHGGQYIKTIYDAPLGYWENPLTEEKFDRWQASNTLDPDTGDVLVYKGLSRKFFQSGVGGKTDLKVILEASGTISSTEEEDIHTIALYADPVTIPSDDPVEGIVDLP